MYTRTHVRTHTYVHTRVHARMHTHTHTHACTHTQHIYTLHTVTYKQTHTQTDTHTELLPYFQCQHKLFLMQEQHHSVHVDCSSQIIMIQLLDTALEYYSKIGANTHYHDIENILCSIKVSYALNCSPSKMSHAAIQMKVYISLKLLIKMYHTKSFITFGILYDYVHNNM